MLYYIAVVAGNCIYILAELVFNVHLIDAASTSTNIEDINRVETFGRTLSTIGLCLLIMKVIKFRNKDMTSKVLILILLVTAVSPSFYYGQKYLINYLADSTSVEQRDNYYNLFLAKKSIMGESEKALALVPFDNNESVEAKVFLSNISILANQSSYVSNINSSVDTQLLAAHYMSRNKRSSIYEEYRNSVVNNDDFVRNYLRATGEFKSDRSSLQSKADNIYASLRDTDTQRKYYRAYRNNLYEIRDARLFLSNTFPNHVRLMASRIGSCTTKECLDDGIENFEDNQIKAAKRKMGEGAKILPTVPFYEICSFHYRDAQRGRKTINHVANGRKYSNAGTTHLDLFLGKENRHMICNINLDELSERYLAALKKEVNENYFIDNEEIGNVDDFINSSEYRNMLLNQQMENDGEIGFYLPKSWRYDDKDTFMDVTIGKKMEKLKKEYRKKIEEEVGHDLGLEQTRRSLRGAEFLRKNYDKKVEEKVGVTVEHSNDIDEFYNYNKDKMEKLAHYELKSFNLEGQEGADVAKMMIIPPIAMFLSLLFVIFNFALLLKDILERANFSDRVTSFVLFSIYMIIAVGPQTVPVVEGHSVLIKDIGESNFLIAFMCDWIVRMEIIFHNTENWVAYVIVNYL